MVSLKFTAEEAKKATTTMCCGGDEMKPPEYPWGLSFTLEDESLRKLGISDLPPVGQPMAMQARVVVHSTSYSQDEGREPRRFVSLQITDMVLAPDGAVRDPAQSLYGGAA